MPMNTKSGKGSTGSDFHDTFAMMYYELNQDEKYEKGEEENKEESKNSDMTMSVLHQSLRFFFPYASLGLLMHLFLMHPYGSLGFLHDLSLGHF